MHSYCNGLVTALEDAKTCGMYVDWHVCGLDSTTMVRFTLYKIAWTNIFILSLINYQHYNGLFADCNLRFRVYSLLWWRFSFDYIVHDASFKYWVVSFCILFFHFVKNVLYSIVHAKTSYNIHDYQKLFVQSVSIYNVIVQWKLNICIWYLFFHIFLKFFRVIFCP